MDLKEIVNRPNRAVLQEDEAYFVLQEYIRIRKNRKITPRIDYSRGTMKAMKETQLLNHMLVHATQWFKENPESIT